MVHVEQIMCYTVDGKEYLFLAKDELEGLCLC